jgi:hypothetical protein
MTPPVTLNARRGTIRGSVIVIKRDLQTTLLGIKIIVRIVTAEVAIVVMGIRGECVMLAEMGSESVVLI